MPGEIDMDGIVKEILTYGAICVIVVAYFVIVLHIIGVFMNKKRTDEIAEAQIGTLGDGEVQTPWRECIERMELNKRLKR